MDFELKNSLNNFLQDIYSNFNTQFHNDVIILLAIGFLRSKNLSWHQSFSIAKKAVSENCFFQNYIECITCSVGCSDFLKVFLEKNSKHFDNIIVVTAPEDNDSIQVAKNYGANVLITDIFYKDGKKFDRGSAYNKALELLKYKSWVCFIDVDIILDDNHRQSILKFGLDKNVFYGIDRLNVITDEDRNSLINGNPFKFHIYCEHEWGFGYYQMFSMNHPTIMQKFINKEIIYPSANDVVFSDFLFRQQFGPGYMDETSKWIWDSRFQKKLPVKCYHIGTNGAGSKSLTIKY